MHQGKGENGGYPQPYIQGGDMLIARTPSSSSSYAMSFERRMPFLDAQTPLMRRVICVERRSTWRCYADPSSPMS